LQKLPGKVPADQLAAERHTVLRIWSELALLQGAQ